MGIPSPFFLPSSNNVVRCCGPKRILKIACKKKKIPEENVENKNITTTFGSR